MGAKDSKPCCITYEEAVKRVTDAELRRIREAFKRVSTLNGCITKQSFVKDVLGEGVPLAVAEYIFTACGGTQKGIALKDLLCGLVLLTRGREDEKLKFLFGLYSNESGTFVVRDELHRLLQSCESGFAPDTVAGLFHERDRATYDEFRDWLLAHADATSLSRWLLAEPCTVTLSNDLETPTFYQTLAGVTHLEESDIIELEKRYWTLKGQSRTGRLDLDTLAPLVSPPAPLAACAGVFAAFDENRDAHIDFKEMACGVSAACRGPLAERQKFCFKVFDEDNDGVLSGAELAHMVDVLLFVRRENKSADELATDPYGQVDAETIMADLLTHASGEGLTTEEYLIWTVDNPLPMDFLNLIYQVCHIALGLRPASRAEEGDIVRGWREREERRGYRVGQFWYLVSMGWWRNWQEYTASGVQLADSPGSSLSFAANGSSASSVAGSLTGSLKRAARNSGRRAQLSLVEDSVALDNMSSVVATGMTPLPESLSPGSKPSSCASSPSHSPRPPRRAPPPTAPGPIDNTGLVAAPTYKAVTLTGEGGKLKRSMVLVRWRDFELVPDALWKALATWYGGSPALPRQVILPRGAEQVELELYPLSLRLLRHQAQTPRAPAQTGWTGMVGGYGAAALSSTGYAYVSSMPSAPKRQLAYVAAFSRMATVRQVYDFLCQRLRLPTDGVRLWHFRDESNMSLLEDEEPTLEDLGLADEDQLLIEVRNKDLTWPEEMGSLAASSQDKRKIVPADKGATGLNNLGNTCFMNAALQCVSNTRALTQYFVGNMHLYELNRTNPLGMKGHIAKRYGDLMHDIWSGTAKTIAPLKLRWTIGKYAPRFNGFQQHDSQELLAFLLDGLHEDLNRVHDKPYVELKDSDGRPDVLVAQEAWENHVLRNKSIIVDLFHGQLKSKVTCEVCGHESVRFDPFNYLSLPLPMESYAHLTVTVVRLDGSVPVKYGLRLNMDEKYAGVKAALAPLTGIPAHLLRLSEVAAAQIKTVVSDEAKIRSPAPALHAYQLPDCRGAAWDEERASLGSIRARREAQTFTAIQRAQPPQSASRASGRGEAPAEDDLWEATERSGGGGVGAGAEALVSPTSVLLAEELSPISRQPGNGDTGSASSGSLAGLSDSEPSGSLGPGTAHGFIVALHRKMSRQDVYFMSSHKSRPSLFGLPVVVPCTETTTHQELYQAVWLQVARLVSPLPPSDTAAPNHAQDCPVLPMFGETPSLPIISDDSLGYEFPFVLKAVQRDGSVCAWCPWYRFCRGCRIQCCDNEFAFGCTHLAIDWDPTALHLRYQTSQEKVCVEHESVALTRQQQTEPIDLDFCLEAFTKEERLGEDEKYYCSKCAQHQVASKKLQIWRLPPILIVHLKRFQCVAGKWVKSQKAVNFPLKDFDPTAYLASVPKQTVIRHLELKEALAGGSKHTARLNGDADALDSADVRALLANGHTRTEAVSARTEAASARTEAASARTEAASARTEAASARTEAASARTEAASARTEAASARTGPRLDALRRERLESTSLARTPVMDGDLQDFHQHRLDDDRDPFSLKYHLYSVVSHSGILGGGHYVSYAVNPNGKWYCYNDSSCKELADGQMDTTSAYMLFYEREGLSRDRYMPGVAGRTPDIRDLDDEFDSDLKRLCSVM